MAKKVVIIAVIGFFLLFFFIIILLFRRGTNTPNENITRITPSSTDLYVVSFSPPRQLPVTTVSRNQEIVFSFSKATLAKSVSITITPELPLQIRQGVSAADVFISPTFPRIWDPGVTYTLHLLKTTRSVDGTPLLNEETYVLESVVPKEPDLEE